MIKSRFKLLSYCLIFALLLTTFQFVFVRQVSASDEYDSIRNKWKVMLTGGTTYNPLDIDIANEITMLTATAQSDWDSMDKTVGRTYLWSDLGSTTISSQVTSMYNRLKDMALAYSTTGSTLQNNATLLSDLQNALNWVYTNRYNENKTQYDNWWDWQIGSPLALNDITVLLYAQLTTTQIANYMNAVNHFTPSVNLTEANRVWQSEVVAVRGVLVKDSVKIASARDGLSDVFVYATSGDGFYTDGSFIQHSKHPYNGGYGASLLISLANVLYALNGSTWAVTDLNLNNVFQWVYNSFEPLMYKGLIMDMSRGRELSRSYQSDQVSGQTVTQAIIRLSQFAPSTDASAFKSMVKYWIQTDTNLNFYSHSLIDFIVLGKAIVSDATIISRGELVKYKQFADMDQSVDLRPGYSVGLSMSSSRVYNYESINAENLKGWYTGDGMTYIYNNDMGQFSDNFWETANPYRLPGTTVDKQTRTSGGNYLSSKKWVGGTELLGLYGTSGMELDAQYSSLTAKKSWFMFDNEIVALGSGITSTDARTIETIVENRKINSAGNNALTVNGTAKSTALGWTETMNGVNWAHLAGSVAGSDIGYYFPTAAAVKGLREARTGTWSSIDGRPEASTTPYTSNYATLWFDHGTNPTNGTYQYVILPNYTAAQTSGYASSPDVTILENSADAQAVKETTLNLVGANFWNDISKTVNVSGSAWITSDKKASVMTHRTSSNMEVSISDPTQANTGTIHLEINAAATGVISMDSGITVTQLSPTIKLTVNAAGAMGATFHANFNFTPPTAAPSAPTLTNAITNGDNSVTLNWNPANTATGYNIKYGTASGSYPNSITAGLTSSFTIPGLTYGTRYYFVVTGTNSFGESTNSNVLSANPLATIIKDDADATGVALTGIWTSSTATSGYYGSDYLNDGNTNKGTKNVTFTPTIPVTDSYNVYLRWTAASNRASNVPVDISNAGGTNTVTVNQQSHGGQWNLLGTYTFNAGTTGSVKIRNDATNGYVVADAVKFLEVTPVPPGAPTLSSTTAGDTKVSLSWATAAGATGYKVKYGNTSGNYTTTIDVGNVASYTITGLTGGTPYYFEVSAYNNSGESANSNELSATPIPENWNLINDDLNNYTAGWTVVNKNGTVIQNSGTVTIIDISDTATYLVKSNVAPATGAFTFEVRAKANNAGTVNEFSVRSGNYLISFYLKYGTAGTAQSNLSGSPLTYTLDTTVFHDYRVVVHSNYTYDLYVDGVIGWRGAINLGGGTNLLKIGGDSASHANIILDQVRMGIGEIVPGAAVITSIATVSVNTFEGAAPTLPSVVSAVYDDQSTALLPIIWDSIQPSQYAQAGIFIVSGAVAGTALRAMANVTVFDMTPPADATLVTNFTAPTNTDVTVTISYPADAVVKEYKVGANGTWTEYTAPAVISENDTVYARGTDAAGNVSNETNVVVSNIDKIAPADATLVANITAPTNTDVTVTISYPADAALKEYKVGANGTWTEYIAPVVISENDTVFARGTDAAGNVSNETNVVVSNIDKIAPADATLVANSSAPTNTDVTVTISYPADAAVKEYKVGANGTWTEYTTPVVVSENNTVYARGTDAAGNVSNETNVMVSNIDKIAPISAASLSPVSPNGSNGWYMSDVTVSLSVYDNLSGVAKTEYQVNNGDWITYMGSVPAFGEGIYKINYRSTDQAGNVEQAQTIEFKIDKTAPLLTVQLDKTSIWPPNHKMVTIHATLNSSDVTSDVASVVLTSITSNEPDSGQGDIQANIGTADASFSLRAERLGKGTGRIYTITYTITDNAGNKSTAVSTVSVPHNQ